MKIDTIVSYIIVIVLVASYFMASANAQVHSMPVSPEDAGHPIATPTPDAYPVPATFTPYPTAYYPSPATPLPDKTPSPTPEVLLRKRLPLPVIIITVGP